MTNDRPGTLLDLLHRSSPSATAMQDTLVSALQDLGLGEDAILSPVCLAYALLKLMTPPEEVSRLLSWREFEQLAAALLRSAGFEVKENVTLTNPRAQIDLIAYGPSIALSVDCKHYSRGHGRSLLANFTKAQLRRSSLLRKKTDDQRPIASVILSASEPEGKFVDGVAVVPVRTLRSFLTTIDSYTGFFDLR